MVNIKETNTDENRFYKYFRYYHSSTAILCIVLCITGDKFIITLLPELKQLYSQYLRSFTHAYVDYLIFWNVQITQCNVRRVTCNYERYKPFLMI
jgi:cytochrome b subunit of formate dehydrogenase